MFHQLNLDNDYRQQSLRDLNLVISVATEVEPTLIIHSSIEILSKECLKLTLQPICKVLFE